MPCVRFLIFIILGVFIVRYVQNFLFRNSLRKEIDGIIARGEAPIGRIDQLLTILKNQVPLGNKDRLRFEKLKKLRQDLRRGVKHVDSRVVDKPSQNQSQNPNI